MINYVRQLYRAFGYSLAGLKVAWQSQWAFRLEILLSVVVLPVAFLIADSLSQVALLISSWLLVLIVEIINSAIEAVVDRISLEPHPLSKRAKDLGSAVVFAACINVVAIWMLVILSS